VLVAVLVSSFVGPPVAACLPDSFKAQLTHFCWHCCSCWWLAVTDGVLMWLAISIMYAQSMAEIGACCCRLSGCCGSAGHSTGLWRAGRGHAGEHIQTGGGAAAGCVPACERGRRVQDHARKQAQRLTLVGMQQLRMHVTRFAVT
jgi:hypothetical protein